VGRISCLCSGVPAYISLQYYPVCCGPGSSVGIATDYGLDGPGSNPGGDEILRPSRPALGPTQPWYRVFPGGKMRPGRAADHSPLLLPQSWNSRAVPLPTGSVTGTLCLIYYPACVGKAVSIAACLSGRAVSSFAPLCRPVLSYEYRGLFIGG